MSVRHQNMGEHPMMNVMERKEQRQRRKRSERVSVERTQHPAPCTCPGPLLSYSFCLGGSSPSLLLCWLFLLFPACAEVTFPENGLPRPPHAMKVCLFAFAHCSPSEKNTLLISLIELLGFLLFICLLSVPRATTALPYPQGLE